MRITTRGRYAVRAIMRLARNTEGKPVAIKFLADDEDISPEFLEQIFFRLRKAGIINSTRGPGGGFSLNRSPDEITLADLFEAVEEGLDVSPCLIADETGKGCDRKVKCDAHELWLMVNQHLHEYFDSITVGSLLSGKTSLRS